MPIVHFSEELKDTNWYIHDATFNSLLKTAMKEQIPPEFQGCYCLNEIVAHITTSISLLHITTSISLLLCFEQVHFCFQTRLLHKSWPPKWDPAAYLCPKIFATIQG